MKLLHYVEIENFKRYSCVQRIDLDHPAEHYHALRSMIPDLRGLVIRDSDGKQHREAN